MRFTAVAAAFTLAVFPFACSDKEPAASKRSDATVKLGSSPSVEADQTTEAGQTTETMEVVPPVGVDASTKAVPKKTHEDLSLDVQVSPEVCDLLTADANDERHELYVHFCQNNAASRDFCSRSTLDGDTKFPRIEEKQCHANSPICKAQHQDVDCNCNGCDKGCRRSHCVVDSDLTTYDGSNSSPFGRKLEAVARCRDASGYSSLESINGRPGQVDCFSKPGRMGRIIEFD